MAQQQDQHTPFWEKVMGGVGLLFLIGIVGFLIYEGVQPTTPPAVTVATERILSTAGGYLVEIRATNVGGATAETVEVEGTLKPAGDPNAVPLETSTVTFDYVPSQATRRGGLFFVQDPAQYLLEVRAKGYIVP